MVNFMDGWHVNEAMGGYRHDEGRVHSNCGTIYEIGSTVVDSIGRGCACRVRHGVLARRVAI